MFSAFRMIVTAREHSEVLLAPINKGLPSISTVHGTKELEV